jgi:hypothetical protein
MAFTNGQETNLGRDMNGIHQVLIYVGDVILIYDSIRERK